MFTNEKRRNRWLDNQAITLKRGGRGGGKAARGERQIRKGWLDPCDGRGRKDALFRFFYSIMQINVRYIKLSTGMAKGRQSRETIFMLLRKQKSAGANLSFLPSRFPFHGFVVPFRSKYEHRDFWHGASLVVGKWKRGYLRGPRWPFSLRPAYVSRKREILHSRRCKIILLSHPLHPTIPFKISSFETEEHSYFPYDSRFLVRSSDLSNTWTLSKELFEKIRVRDSKLRLTEIVIIIEKSALHWQISGSPTNFDIRWSIPVRHGVMERGVFRLRSVNRVGGGGRGHETWRNWEAEKERWNGGGCFNEIAVMPCKWLGNSFRGFLCPPPDCTPA